ncbi:MAG: leucine-rich repeat domain-containing protein [Bacteroidales bacterium]|nr:leucine-rich repeat domain-containing protein [Bacteroidales bacterium]
MKTLKIIIAKLLLSISLSAITFNSFSQETDYDFSDDKTGTTIYYNVTVDEFPLEVAITFGSYDFNSYSGVVTIPEKVVKDGWSYAVTSVWENAFAHSDKLAEVQLPENIKYIEDAAFMGCENLKTITPFNNVEEIGMIAFMNCSSLESISFGDKLTLIGDNAFDNCKSLKSISIKSVIPPTLIGSLGKTAPTIYVPKESVNSYKNSVGWNKLNILEITE